MFAVAEQLVPNSNIFLLSALCAIALAIIHLFSGKLRLLRTIGRSRWLSFGSGVSVAYVFVHILPELSEAQETIQSSLDFGLVFLEHHVYLVAFIGSKETVAVVLAKALAQAQGVAVYNPENVIRSLDIFVMLANVNLIGAHFLVELLPLVYSIG
jgi:Protein of unknown function (DUF3611)